MTVATCPGCSIELEPTSGLPAPKFHSSAECWALYGELAATFTLPSRDPAFPHQYVVDAYTAQHVGADAKPIAAVFALVGLCLALERGATGRQAQLAHMELAKIKRDWPCLQPTVHRFDITVRHVLQEPTSEGKLARIREWMRCTWDAWAHEHQTIRELVRPIALRPTR
jgi:hypothetical protein